MKTDDLIQEIQSLPVDERARLADCVLRSLNQTLPAIDQKWTELATQRLVDISHCGSSQVKFRLVHQPLCSSKNAAPPWPPLLSPARLMGVVWCLRPAPHEQHPQDEPDCPAQR